MKAKIMWPLIIAAAVVNVIYLGLVVDSFVTEYVMDKFSHWGFPQWGWMYADTEVYVSFNICYILLMAVLLAAAVILAAKKCLIAAFLCLIPELLSMGWFWYAPNYNFQKQFDIFMQEKGATYTRIPEGKWWVFKDQLERYDDASDWEKLKGYFGRGEWPGGYPIWGEYRVWLLPDLATDTLGRRGMVLHGGTMDKSPWGINLRDDVLDMAIGVRESNNPLEMKFEYSPQDGGQPADAQ